MRTDNMTLQRNLENQVMSAENIFRIASHELHMIVIVAGDAGLLSLDSEDKLRKVIFLGTSSPLETAEISAELMAKFVLEKGELSLVSPLLAVMYSAALTVEALMGTLEALRRL